MHCTISEHSGDCAEHTCQCGYIGRVPLFLYGLGHGGGEGDGPRGGGQGAGGKGKETVEGVSVIWCVGDQSHDVGGACQTNDVHQYSHTPIYNEYVNTILADSLTD